MNLRTFYRLQLLKNSIDRLHIRSKEKGHPALSFSEIEVELNVYTNPATPSYYTVIFDLEYASTATGSKHFIRFNLQYMNVAVQNISSYYSETPSEYPHPALFAQK